MESEPVDVVFTVNVQGIELCDGKFTPYVSVIQQQGRKITSFPFELGEKEQFDSEEEAMAHGKQRAEKLLKKKYPTASIRIN